MIDDKFRTYLIRYRHDGAEWSIELPARSYEDAKARLGKLAYANVDGELIFKLPAGTGLLAAIITTIRNAGRRLLQPQ